jgi:hypothetical protein
MRKTKQGQESEVVGMFDILVSYDVKMHEARIEKKKGMEAVRVFMKIAIVAGIFVMIAHAV